MNYFSISDEAKKQIMEKIKQGKTLAGKFKKTIGAGVLAASIAIGNAILSNDSITVGIVEDKVEDNYEKGVPVYESPETKVLFSMISDGTLITINDKVENGKEKYIKINFLSNKNKKLTGYIPEEYLKSSVTIDSNYSLYRVNAEKALNLRNMPQVENSEKLTSLPRGTIVMGKQENDKWSKVIYINKNALIEGYSASRFLTKENNERVQEKKRSEEKPNVQEERKQKADDIKPEIKYNSQDGRVFGIDVCEMRPKVFEDMLTGEIPIQEFIHTIHKNKIDLSRYKNRVPDFVYFKLSASRYRGDDLRKGSDVPFKEMSEVCEKLGVPYGFYYYSTCINEAEAKQEYEWICEHMGTLDKEKYHKLPFVLDIEIADDADRQFKAPRNEVTDAKILLANLVEKKYGKVMVYTAMNTLETVFDIEQFQKGVESGNCGVWLVSPSKRFLRFPQVKAEYEKVKPYVMSMQIVLDAYLIPPSYTTVMKKVEIKEDEKDKAKGKDGGKTNIKGAKTAEKGKFKDNSNTKVKDRKNSKDEKKDKPSKQASTKKQDGKSQKDKKTIKKYKMVPVVVYTKGKHLIDINIFDAKMFEQCINGEYQKANIDVCQLNNESLIPKTKDIETKKEDKKEDKKEEKER